MIATITVLTVLATIAVITRCIARKISKVKFGWDDWLIMLALVSTYGVTIAQYVGTEQTTRQNSP